MEPPEHARAAAPGATGDPLVGRLLDRRYRIGARVARGGMASVYEATDIRLDRTVAVKVMHPGLGDDDDFAAALRPRGARRGPAQPPARRRRLRPGRRHLRRPDTVFLAMEYVPGHTLRDVIRKESPMTPARALALLEPVVSALAAAHRAGLIHRDVKPENVLIGDEAHGGRVKVADFGLAKAVSADTQHTATGGVLIGTVSYLAPELVVDGRSDARADVYAAGVVLYELLTGNKPHEGESPDPGRLPPRPRGRARSPSARRARHSGLRRCAGRPRHRARPQPATRRRGGAAPPVHRVAQALREGLASTTPSSPPTWRRAAHAGHRRRRRGTRRHRARAVRRRWRWPATEVDPPTRVSRRRQPGPTTTERTGAPQLPPPGRRLSRPRCRCGRRRAAPPPGPSQARRARSPRSTTTARRRSVKGPTRSCSSCSCSSPASASAPGGSASPATPRLPGVLGVTEAAATAELEQAGLERRGRRPGATPRRRGRAGASPPTRSRASRCSRTAP